MHVSQDSQSYLSIAKDKYINTNLFLAVVFIHAQTSVETKHDKSFSTTFCSSKEVHDSQDSQSYSIKYSIKMSSYW